MMENTDNVSIKSSDSATTSGDYEMVPEDIDLSEKTLNPLPSEEPTGKTDKSLTIDKNIDMTNKKMTPVSPILNIASNGDLKDLEKNLNEVIHELDTTDSSSTQKEIQTQIDKGEKSVELYAGENSMVNLSATSSTLTVQKEHNLKPLSFNPEDKKPLRTPESTSSTTAISPDLNKVGKSVFYDCLDVSPMAEKQDDMKPEKNSDTDEDYVVSDINQECTIFSGVTYLGAATISTNPKSEQEIHRIMNELNASTGSAGLKVSVSIPSCSDGLVVLYDAKTNAVFSHYDIHRILFYARGAKESVDKACFAFTWSHGDSQESAIYQCHVFRCNIPEAVNQVSSCFMKAFQRIPQSLTCSITSSAVDNNSIMLASITSDITGNPLTSAMYEFAVTLEIKEKVTKNSYSSVVRERSCFKLRCNTDKEVSVTVKQVPSDTLPPLFIERCFGVLLSPGKLVKQADMQLLDMVSMGYLKSENVMHQHLLPYQIRAEWKANEKAFEQLNLESQKTYITVAVDLVIKGIQEPVRFVIETQVTILLSSEIRFMENLFQNKRPMLVKFYIQLKKNEDDTWILDSIDHSDEIVDPPQQSLLNNLKIKNLSKMVRSSSAVSFDLDDLSPTDLNGESDDEPLLSGTGEVSKDCSKDRLDEWSPVISEWTTTGKRPKNLANLVRAGIPEALRCQIWQKLANVDNRTEMTDQYRVLITKETKCENMILRDINRTFPAHKFFKESGGSGQDSLYKCSKAYAVYDAEVGYCQGLSFIAASLLLHMPEEEAFSVLVAIMFQYGLRDLYKLGFENLYLRLYQLKRLMKDQLPDLYEHFENTGVECHMFASQWFLTLFTARFPLYFVFHILDVFLLDGIHVLFQVAMTLLYMCKKDLLELDFEGILKYVRVSLPRKCRSEQQAQKLMKLSSEWKLKKLKKYEDEYQIQKEENEKAEQIMKQYEMRFIEEKKIFRQEITDLQEKVEKLTAEEKKYESIVSDYKQIIQRQEQQISKFNDILEEMTKTITSCKMCSTNISPYSPIRRIIANSTSHSRTNSIDLLTETDQKDGGDFVATQELPLGPLDPLNEAFQRIRELELELAQAKLAKVEAECRNQDLNHQLTSTLSELQLNRNHSTAPGVGPNSSTSSSAIGLNSNPAAKWFSNTLNSIQEKVKRDHNIATFQSYTPDLTQVKSSSASSVNKLRAMQRNSINVLLKEEPHAKLPSESSSPAKTASNVSTVPQNK